MVHMNESYNVNANELHLHSMQENINQMQEGKNMKKTYKI